jgi:hypothetical protein
MADIQPFGLQAHLQDLENEALEAEREEEEFKDRVNKRQNELHDQINQFVARVQKEKEQLTAQLNRKKLFASDKRKQVEDFKVSRPS